MNPTHYMRRKDAAEYLKSRYGFGSVSSLAKLAVFGGGPEFRKAGAMVLYEQPALDAWARAKISGPLASTSDRVEAAA